jgi:hypothetical protein
MIGDGKSIADEIEDWYTSGACDGFNIHVGYQPDGLSHFVDHVVPELQRRGIYKTAYRPGTLREKLGFGIPPNPRFEGDRDAAE